MAILVKGKNGCGVSLGDYGEGDGLGYIGYIEPACENPQWILWFEDNGDAVLYTEREPNGGVIGEPIKLLATKKVKS